MISVIIPALNEEKKLRNTICDIIQSAKECGEMALDIVIVNDGSSDGTAKIIGELEQQWPFIRSIHNEKNLGMGYCIKKALKMLKYDRFISIPGDNDMPKELIVALFRNAERADMVMAYFLNNEERGRLRNLLSALFNMIYAYIFNIYVQYLNGPATFPTRKVKELELRSQRFSIMAEMKTKLLLSGCSFHEIGGYMQTGESGSSAVSFSSFIEVVSLFIRLFFEVKITNRKYYDKLPHRVY